MTVTSTRAVDRYPTRVIGEPGLIDRTDPTVWTDQPGPVDTATLASHDAKGYSIADGVLSKREVETYWQELVRLTGDPGLRADERVVIEKESQEIRSIFEVHRISQLIAELITDPRILDRACQLLGSEVYVHQSRVNFMPGFKGKGFYWHSDFETWHAEDGMPAPRAVSMSLALTDNYPFNGGLMVMPGSHRTFVPCTGQTPANHYRQSLKEQEIGVPSRENITALAAKHGIDQFTGEAGCALWFDANIMHGSGNNITPFPRSNIFVVFNSVENTLQEPYAAPQPRPTFIASRDFTPLARTPRV
ncbi:ectoine hydroxylase [Kibdelosporangium philippinense]|uniref:Ectoine hydroxylase n=1 Tax=Kibdelosporangium philippinense TaxID=211113 RepID=A0ABS8ZN55_9PSEU|nr:ectoine hydroxylase [Kibdelosporangium philippinense]MCE7009164.1 ectoine hydroxylase [Kibdelosporangium philippinense]